MRVLRSGEPGFDIGGGALAIGNFDGVHLGHRALLDAAREEARSLGAPAGALIFEPHPAKVLNPEMAPRLMTTLPRRLELLAEAGLDTTLIQTFDRAFASIAAKDFVDRVLIQQLRARSVVVGEDFSFGKGRAGSVRELSVWLPEGGSRLRVVPQVKLEGIPISSTRIREMLHEGHVEGAARLLGRPFDLDGTVVRGMGRGATIGWPTANVQSDNELLPLNGVYAVRARFDGKELPGAANLGRKPTFGEGGAHTIEVHLIDHSGESVLGQTMRVIFIGRLRDELRFPSVEALTAQIGRDVERARVLAGAGRNLDPA
jgi:riboflavin kinase/FMN adenylyltransferase